MKINLLKISTVTAIVTMLIGMLVVIGWFINNDFLKSIIPGAASMKFNTGVCFFVSGFVLLLQLDTHIRIHKLFKSSLPAVICFISLLTLLQYIFSLNLGIDELFVIDADANILSNPYPGRMSQITAFCFNLIGLAFLLMRYEKVLFLEIAQILLHIVSLLAFIGMVGYLLNIPTFYKLSYLSD
jgi:hypothetical protein